METTPLNEPPRGTVLTVFGAKGGIGKTTIATNLAASVAQAGLNVIVMDMDTQYGDVAGLLGVEPRYTVVDLALRAAQLDQRTLRRALVQHERTRRGVDPQIVSTAKAYILPPLDQARFCIIPLNQLGRAVLRSAVHDDDLGRRA